MASRRTPFCSSCFTVAKRSSVAKAMCCTPEPNSSVRKRDDCVRWLCEALSTMRSPPSDDSTTWLRPSTPGPATRIGHLLRRDLLEIEQRGVEQEPGQHLLVLHRLGNVIDGGKSGVVASLAGIVEFTVPHTPRAVRS